MASLGIDFGSTNTTVSWINPLYGKPVAIKFNGDGSVKYPSVIMAIENGLVTGYQALSYLEEVDKLDDEPRLEFLSNFILSLKRILNPSGIEYIGGKKYTHLQLLRLFFEQIKGLAEAHSQTIFDDAIISHPVDFEQENIQLLEKSLLDVGFKKVSLKMEPLSAVEGYGIEHEIQENQGIMVFDFGGGTIDVAYVRKTNGVLRLLCEPKGNRTCGGQDIDMLIYENLRKKMQHKYSIDISSNNITDYGMLNACKRLKEYFSDENSIHSTSILLVNDGKLISYKYTLNRDSFNNIIISKVSEAISVAQSVISQVNKKGLSIDKVLLIGGSSQLSLVRNMLLELLPDSKIDTCGEKDIAVALGNLSDLVVTENIQPDEPQNNEESHVVIEPDGKTGVKCDDNNNGVLLINW